MQHGAHPEKVSRNSAGAWVSGPDHTEKSTLWRLLDVQANTGMLITESFAMWPGSSERWLGPNLNCEPAE